MGPERFMRTPFRLPWRFSTRTLLLLVTTATLICAFAIPRYIEIRCIRTVSEQGDQVFTEPRGLFLLRQFVGEDVSQRAVYVHLRGPHVTDEWIKNVQGLRYIEVLNVSSPSFTDAGLRHLKSLPNLASLHLDRTQVTQAGIEELRAALPNLRRVSLSD